MPKVWAGYKPPEWIDPDAFLYMGADPSWTPAKEGIHSATPLLGECSHCKGRGTFAHDDDGSLVRDESGAPIFLLGAIEDGSHAVCPKCRRYGQERRVDKTPISAMLRPVPEWDGDDESVGTSGVSVGGKAAGAAAMGSLDLTDLAFAVRIEAEPGTVVKAVAAGSVTVPERFAYLLDG